MIRLGFFLGTRDINIVKFDKGNFDNMEHQRNEIVAINTLVLFVLV